MSCNLFDEYISMLCREYRVSAMMDLFLGYILEGETVPGDGGIVDAY